jgi:hypothetical protein
LIFIIAMMYLTLAPPEKSISVRDLACGISACGLGQAGVILAPPAAVI